MDKLFLTVGTDMKTLFLTMILMAARSALLGQTPQDYVGTWKNDPRTPTMTRKLEFDGHVILMTELQPGRNGGPEMTIIRKYPTDGNEVKMDTGVWAGAAAVGKWENGILTVDTTMANGRKFRDVWRLSADKKHYTNEMVISRGGAGGGGTKGGGGGQDGNAQGTVKFSFTEQE
jgi:hypothetical protein